MVQGYSQNTAYKQFKLRYFMACHASIVRNIQRRFSENLNYLYIDLNCGKGHQPEYESANCEPWGSPVIAVEELNKKGIIPYCYFVDIDPGAIATLKEVFSDRSDLRCYPSYWTGDSCQVFPELAHSIEEKHGNTKNNGLIYIDPNGNQIIPLKSIRECCQNLKSLNYVDLLMHCSATYLKRWANNRLIKREKYNLEQVVTEHGKRQVFISFPPDATLKLKREKWTFVYATNYDKSKDINKIGMYKVTENTNDLGGKIFRHLVDSSHPLPVLETSRFVQGSLFDVNLYTA